MTFARQIHTARLVLVLLAALLAATFTLNLTGRQWVLLAVTIPVLVPVGWLLHAEWRLVSQQQGIADLAQRLREISRAVPDGMDRLYTSVLSTQAVLCHQDKSSGFDQFSRIDVEDLEELDRVRSGEVVNLPASTYRVRRSLPLVWRHVWADRAVKTREHGSGFARLPQPATGYRSVLKALLLNHRTGALVPDRTELADLLRAIENADHARDIPRKTK